MFHYRQGMSVPYMFNLDRTQSIDEKNKFERDCALLRGALFDDDSRTLSKMVADGSLIRMRYDIRYNDLPAGLLDLAIKSDREDFLKFVMSNQLFAIDEVAEMACECAPETKKIVEMMNGLYNGYDNDDRAQLHCNERVCKTIDGWACEGKCEKVEALWHILGDEPFRFDKLSDISSVDERWCSHCYATISASGFNRSRALQLALKCIQSSAMGPRTFELFEKSVEVMASRVPLSWLFVKRPEVLDALLRHPSAWSSYCLHDILDACFTPSLSRLSDGIGIAKKLHITEGFDSLKRVMGANRIELLLKAADSIDVINITRDQMVENFGKFPALLKYMTSEEIASSKTLLNCLKKRNEQTDAVLVKVREHHPDAFYMCGGALGRLLRLDGKKYRSRSIINIIKKEIVGNVVGTLCLGQMRRESPLSLLDVATVRHIITFLRLR